MRSRLVLAACALAIAAPAAARPFTADDLVAIDRLTSATLSPDGRTLAYATRTYEGPPNRTAGAVWIVDVSRPGAKPRSLVPKGAGIGGLQWSKDGASVYHLATRDGLRQVWRTSVADGTSVPITQVPVDISTFRLSEDEKTLVVSADVFPDCPDLACTRRRLDARKGASANITYRDLGVRFNDVWEDDLRNGLYALRLEGAGPATDGAPLTRGHMADVPSKPSGNESAYAISPDGRTVIFSARLSGLSASATPAQHLFSVPLQASATPQRLDVEDAAGSAAQPAFSPDGRSLAYVHQPVALSDGGAANVVVRDLATGRVRRLGTDLDRAPQDISWSADGRTIYAIVEDEGQQRAYAFDARSGAARPLTGEGSVSAIEPSKAGLLYLWDDFAHPTQAFLRSGSGAARRLTDVGAAQLAGVEMAPHHSFTFRGWNGEPVQGFVVEPLDRQPGRTYPVVFLIHGGPHGAYDNAWSYLRNPQVWSGRGYATVMINFHGSTGFGEAFAKAVQKHWGDRPLEDLKAGWATALSQYPFLDGGRACAMGSSYGGYMVNWIAGVWNEPWRCLVSHAGVFDVRAGGLSGDLVWYKEVQFGSPLHEPEAFERFNPRNHVAQWSKPILFTHGGRDLRVTVNDSVSGFIAAQKLGVPSELLYLPDANHLITRPQDTLDWYAAVNGWLDRWTVPQ